MTMHAAVVFLQNFFLDFFSIFSNYFSKEKKLGRNIIQVYIVKELLLYFAVSFLFFFAIFFVNQILLLAENILRQGAPAWDVAKLMTYSLPFIIAQSAPFATLVGFLMCLGRFMSDNEIIIFRASGFSYRYLVRPVLFLGLAISVLSFFVNDYLLPLGTIKFNRLRLEILRSNPAIQLETNAVKNFNNATLVTGNVSDENVSDVVLIDKGNDGSLRIVSALDSMLTSGRREGVLLNMNMSDVTSIFIDQKNAKNFDVVKAGKVTLNIFDSAFISDYESVSPSEMTAYDLAKSVRKMRKEKSTDDYTLNIYTLEYNKKFSLPFGSFFFALLALPLALLFGKQNGQTIGMILGIVISFFYWAMMILGQYAASRNGFSGFWSMWIPNIVIGVSAFLFYTTLRKK